MRITRELLAEKRRSRTSRILVTGGTGFLGSHIMADLLAKGYPLIVLARSNGLLAARARLDRMLDWFGLDDARRSRIEVVEGSIDQPNLGMASPEYSFLLDGVDEIIHCASDTSFSERKRSEVERTNIGGTENMLDLAEKGRCVFFHYVSTAYVAGRKAGICREELVENETFTNVYEEVKCRAERIVAERCANEGIRFSLYRPSVVYGNAKTGRSTRFNAIYYPVRLVLFLKNLYDTDIRERNGEKAREMGVRVAADGSLYLPIRVEVEENSGVNLIPVDYFVNAFTAIMDECLDGGIFHVVNQKHKGMGDLIDYTQKFFNISGIEPCPTGAFEGNGRRNALEVLFDTYLEAYRPYMRDARTFENRKAHAVLSKKGVVCPDFDFEVFSRCMNYAIECGWGARVFTMKGKRIPKLLLLFCCYLLPIEYLLSCIL